MKWECSQLLWLWTFPSLCTSLRLNTCFLSTPVPITGAPAAATTISGYTHTHTYSSLWGKGVERSCPWGFYSTTGQEKSSITAYWVQSIHWSAGVNDLLQPSLVCVCVFHHKCRFYWEMERRQHGGNAIPMLVPTISSQLTYTRLCSCSAAFFHASDVKSQHSSRLR